MRKLIYTIVAAIGIIAATGSCSEGNGGKNFDRKNDSLLKENVFLMTFIEHVAHSMDSIIAGEECLIKAASTEGTPQDARQKISENLNIFEGILKHQHEQIAQLEKMLDGNTSGYAGNMRTILNAFKLQLDAKDKQISILKQEIENKDFDITRLDELVASLSENVRGLTRKTQKQQATLNSQADKLNEAFVLVGDKEKLQKAGALSGSSLFKKAKLKQSDFKTSMFNRVDIRKYKSATFKGSDPKLLTPAPEKSYKLADNGDGTSTLKIVDADSFWSVSNYLVIQVKY